MEYFAAMIDLKGKRVTVIGGGTVAERKVQSLLGTGATIEVISLSLTNSLRALVDSKPIIWKRKSVEKHDLIDAFFVIAATNDIKTNREVTLNCHPHQLVLNVSEPQLANVIMPALLKKDNLHIAVSTNGASPSLAKKIRDLLRDVISDDIGTKLATISEKRKEIIKTVENPLEKEQLLNSLVKNFTL
ncbi:precorrin-2 dehydrogenase/sirohydrochlorin ferrochelatase family protein [Pseudogracilibacillus sp. SO30301A]|uniref:precorrin-2 dehydrogenase/sirohydrochlorin ferrochelatase family protein n=1 Tax=Pseudogracilibacillus sp. SO30301A TaxID=3098291 RepID=UPI00300E453B